MKTTEEYLDDYFDFQNELERKGERWRLRVTPEEFIKEIARIREYGIEARKSNFLTEAHIQMNQKGMVGILLMEKATIEEMREQFERHRKAAEIEFAKEAPAIQKELRNIRTPLCFEDTVNIYRWLWRKQITMEMLPENVAEEFKKTWHYELLVRRNKEESI